MRRFLTLLAATVLLAACGQAEPWRQESYVFGTRVDLAIAGMPEARARAAADRVLRDFDYLHRSYHAWQPSDLSTLNEAIAAGRGHEVSAEFAAFIREAQAVAAAGDHLFDPGIGRLIALWGFHTDDIQPRLPEPGAVAALVARHPSIADLSVSEGHCLQSRRGEPKSPASGRGRGMVRQKPKQYRSHRLRRLPEGRRARPRRRRAEAGRHRQCADQHRRQRHCAGQPRWRRHPLAHRHPASAPAGRRRCAAGHAGSARRRGHWHLG